jgi:mono/diheme cytochrome c family protein
MQKTWILAVAGLAIAGCVKEAPISGKRLYSENCAACHGAKGQGDGPFAKDLIMPPADLSTLSVNNGGTFPRNYVISTMDGYARGDHFSGAMPEFGVKLAGKDVIMETGDGVVTPTPAPLVALANYLESLQG